MEGIKITVAEDGSITIPREFLERLGLHPKEEVFLREQEEGLLIQKTRKSYLSEIGQLLKEVLREADWAEIEKAREDRCF